MPSQSWKALDIGGLTPALDLRRAQGVYALSGQNYVFDSQGPKSAFGNRLLSTDQITGPNHFQGVRFKLQAGDRVFQFSATEILEWNESSGDYISLYSFTNTDSEPHRWTHAYLNGKLYFCHPTPGIIVLDLNTSSIGPLTGPGVPTEAKAICEDNGRLIAIDAVAMYWSTQADGSDFAPQLGGAGFQVIGERVSGSGIMVSSFSKGVLTWTSGGVMCSTFTGDSEVYRHRAINTEYRPINSFCVAQMNENTVMILDERGLFESNGASPTAKTPLFNEFLLNYLQKNNLSVGQNVRIEWDELRRFLYVMVSTSFASPIYEKAFVLYPPLDKWGSFDEPHYGIVPVRIQTGQRADDYYGFLGTDRRVRIWMDVGSRHDSSGSLIPLDALLRVGLIRLEGLQESNDQLVSVNQVMIGNVISGDPDVLAEDYDLIPAGHNEDYNTASGAEDLGFEKVNYINHKIRVIGTIDGTRAFDVATPKLTLFTMAARYYSLECSGVWHILELSADAVGESFHCRAFELTAVYAGKLN